MSTSDTGLRSATLAGMARHLEHQVDQLLSGTDGAPLEVDEETLRAIVTAAARLHARRGETGTAIDPLRADVSPTEAIDLACGLLRARDLNPFDLALWFSRLA